jgi:hypothetical protein
MLLECRHNKEQAMEYAILIVLVALVQYLAFTMRVGLNRGKLGVKAPDTTGNETW